MPLKTQIKDSCFYEFRCLQSDVFHMASGHVAATRSTTLAGLAMQATATPPRQQTTSSSTNPSSTGTDDEFEQFSKAVNGGANVVPLCRRIFSDQLTPVVAYRCLIKVSMTVHPTVKEEMDTVREIERPPVNHCCINLIVAYGTRL